MSYICIHIYVSLYNKGLNKQIFEFQVFQTVMDASRYGR